MTAKSRGGGLSTEQELFALGIIGAVIFVMRSGGISQAMTKLFQGATNAAISAGQAVAGGVVDAASGAAAGVASSIGSQFGLPSVGVLTDDQFVSRWIIDAPNGGQIAASQWSTAQAYALAQSIPRGMGTAPPSGSVLAAQNFQPYAGPTDVAGNPVTGDNGPATFDEYGNLISG